MKTMLCWKGSLARVALIALVFTSTAKLASGQVAGPPVMVSASATIGGSNVTVLFNEPVVPEIATDVFNYFIDASDGSSLSVVSAVLTADQQTVILDLDPFSTFVPGVSYTLGACCVCDLEFDCMLTEAIPITLGQAPAPLIAAGSVWRYLDTGTDPGTIWVQPSFNDSLWKTGPAELGYGDLDEATVINSMVGGSRLLTAYFRHTFNVADASAITGLTLQLWRDDGAIVYLNGVEVFRNNMPAGPVTYSTLASAIAGDDGNTPLTAQLTPALLVNGANLIAVEVHQNSPASSDLTFDLSLASGAAPVNNPPVANSQSVTVQANTPTLITLSGSDPDGDSLTFVITSLPAHGTLSGTPPNVTYAPQSGYAGPDSFTFKVNDGATDSAPATILIEVQAVSTALLPAGSVWKYLDTGIDPGPAWIDPSYNDSSWLAGPAELGFGDFDEATVIRSTNITGPLITAYFRRTFTVADPSEIGSLSLQLWRDDGAVVYLNGVEVFRNNMPAGAVTYSTLALSAAPDDGNIPLTAQISSSLLVSGQNLIAVVVHQNALTSSDLSFDLQLDASEPPGNSVLLSGLVEFSTDTQGNFDNQSVWNTRGGDSAVNLWVIRGTDLFGPFVNGPSDAAAGISISLDEGENHFVLYGNRGGFLPQHGLNLFFNGDNNTPRISVFGPTQTSADPPFPPFSANGSSSTLTLAFQPVPGANTLSFQQGDLSIQLTHYRWAGPDVYNIDRVSQPVATPDGTTDLIGHFTLNVTRILTNQPPTANNQSVTTSQNTPVAITLTGSDPDSDPLTFTVTSGPSHGSLSGTPPNVTYSPATDYLGPDSFTFKVNDGQLDSANATVSIQVVTPLIPPDLLSATACGSVVTAAFNEALDPVSASDLFNYVISGSDGSAIFLVSAVLESDQRTVSLTVDPSTPFLPGISYTLTVNSICDTFGACLSQDSVPLQFDTTPPAVTCGVAVNSLFPPNGRLVDVGLSATASEGTLQVQIFSDEPEDADAGDAIFEDGVLQLRASRNSHGDGRVYLIVVTAMDACGNIGTCCTTVVVPHNFSKAARNSANAQAAAAQAQCSPQGAPSTPHQIVVGSRTFDLSADFSPLSNPAGVWTHGYQATLGGQFVPFTIFKYNFDGAGVPVEVWTISEFTVPAAMHNATTFTVTSDGGQGVFPPGTVWFYPGPSDLDDGGADPNDNYGVIRFTAPANGAYSLESAVRSAYTGPISGDTDFHVLHNGVELFGQFLPEEGSTSVDIEISLAAGDTIDFVIGRGLDNSFHGSGLIIDATLTRVQ